MWFLKHCCAGSSNLSFVLFFSELALIFFDQILTALEADFEVFDIFTDEKIRQGVKTYSDWPTIPQLYIGGEFIGGSDIMIEMYKSGQLKKELDKVAKQ
jgi:Grx4 family monothiol glutaredoxin